MEAGGIGSLHHAQIYLRDHWGIEGCRPPWTHEREYRWLWLYAAVEPLSGACVVLFLPHVDSACFQRFPEERRRDTGTERLGVVLDNSGSHTRGQVIWPEGVAKIPRSPYSPELLNSLVK